MTYRRLQEDLLVNSSDGAISVVGAVSIVSAVSIVNAVSIVVNAVGIVKRGGGWDAAVMGYGFCAPGGRGRVSLGYQL